MNKDELIEAIRTNLNWLESNNLPRDCDEHIMDDLRSAFSTTDRACDMLNDSNSGEF